MGVEMVVTCSRKGSRTHFTPELGLRFSGWPQKAAKSTVFLAALSQLFISGVKSACDGACRPRPGWGDHPPAIPAGTQRRLRAGRDPRGGVWSAPTGSSAVAE